MKKAPQISKGKKYRRILLDHDDPLGEDALWFKPLPDSDAHETDDDSSPGAEVAQGLDPQSWLEAERAQYQNLLRAAEATARFSEKLAHAPVGSADRLAVLTVTHVLKSEGIWLGPERVALYRALRLATDQTVRDLTRANWGWRRLMQPVDPLRDLRAFLGRSAVQDASSVPGDDRPVGAELDAIVRVWTHQVSLLDECHPLTRAAYAFMLWRFAALTPVDDVLEPTVAALRIGAGQGGGFLPLTSGDRLDARTVSAGPEMAGIRLSAFYAAIEQGALGASIEIDRLAHWKRQADRTVADLSGRTPPLLIGLFLEHPIVSAELTSDALKCSKAAARRNLATLAERGLIREITGHMRFRYWTIRWAADAARTDGAGG